SAKEDAADFARHSAAARSAGVQTSAVFEMQGCTRLSRQIGKVRPSTHMDDFRVRSYPSDPNVARVPSSAAFHTFGKLELWAVETLHIPGRLDRATESTPSRPHAWQQEQPRRLRLQVCTPNPTALLDQHPESPRFSQECFLL